MSWSAYLTCHVGKEGDGEQEDSFSLLPVLDHHERLYISFPFTAVLWLLNFPHLEHCSIELERLTSIRWTCYHLHDPFRKVSRPPLTRILLRA
jgi:hypothetical protein